MTLRGVGFCFGFIFDGKFYLFFKAMTVTAARAAAAARAATRTAF